METDLARAGESLGVAARSLGDYNRACYLSRLLPLPAFLIQNAAPATPQDIHNGFRLTGHFLGERLFADLNKPVPEARFLMIDRLERAGRLSPTDSKAP